MQCAEQRPHTGRAHQKTHGACSAAENVVGKDRQEHGVLQPEKAQEAQQEQGGANGPVAHGEAKALGQLLERGAVLRSGLSALDAHGQQRRNDGEEADAIEEEAPPLP